MKGKACRVCGLYEELQNYARCRACQNKVKTEKYFQAKENPIMKVCTACGKDFLSRYTAGACNKCRHTSKRSLLAKDVECACGCGGVIKDIDLYGRDVKYIPGHNSDKKHRDATARKKASKTKNKDKNHKKCAEQKKNRYHIFRIELLNMAGGKCTKCELKYNGKNAPAFHFHHLTNKEI